MMDICGDSRFWTGEELTSDIPRFTDCFQTTVLEWSPFVWLFISLPFYLLYLVKHDDRLPLPLTAPSVLKSCLCVALFVITLLEIWTANHHGYHCQEDQQIPGSFYIGVTFRAVPFAVLAMVIQHIRHRGVVSSAVIYVYWCLLAVCSIIPLQSRISYYPTCEGSILFYIYFAFVCVQLVLHSFADKRSTSEYHSTADKKPECPENDASWISTLSFMWFLPTVIQAYKKKLSSADLWQQTERLKCENAVAEVYKNWEKEQNKLHKLNRQNMRLKRKKNTSTYVVTPRVSKKERRDGKKVTRKPSLYMTLIKTYWFALLQGVLVKILCDAVLLLQPQLLRIMIAYIETRDTPTPDQIWTGYALAVVFFLTGETQSFLFHQSEHISMTLGLRIKTSLVGIIYQKALRMSNVAKKDYKVGEIVNLMSVDCQRIQNAFQFLYYCVAFFTTMIIGVLEIWYTVDVTTLAAVGIVLIFAGLNIFFGKLQERYQKRLLKLKGNRIKLLNEVLAGIKVLKMFAWEPTFADKLLSIRNQESHFLKKIAVVSAAAIVLGVHSQFMMTWAIFLIYILTNTSVHLSPQTVFLVLSVVNILKIPTSLVPNIVSTAVQAYVSIGRIQTFLWEENLDKSYVKLSDTAEHAITINNGQFTWDRERPVPSLSNINLQIPEGRLVAIVGEVGAGKSSLINAVLGEMERLQGEITVKGSIAYVPQEAWIQNMTLRDNILYGKTYQERKYNIILEACELKPDLAILPAGDMTEIGIGGINLSGGQKQRVSLARAVYNNADIYLFDDPLSAVDAHVGKNIFKNVLSKDGLLRNKTRVLVTHGVHWLPNVDKIVVMNNGQILDEGTYEELIQHNRPFAQFLQAHLMKDDSDEEEALDTENEMIKNNMRGQVELVTSEDITSDVKFAEGQTRTRRNPTCVEQDDDSGKEATTTWLRDQSSDFFYPDIDSLKDKCANKEKKTEELYTSVKASSIISNMAPKEEKSAVQVGKLTQQEALAEGSIKRTVVKALIKAVGFISTVFISLLIVTFQALSVYSNYWLTDWSEDSYLGNLSLSSTQEYSDKNIHYLVVYSVLGILQGVFLIGFGLLAHISLVLATGILHKNMLQSIMKSPMSFFDTTPIGRIMNRFSSDIDVMDNGIPPRFRMMSVVIMNLISAIVVVTIQTPIFVTVLLPVSIVYVLLLRLHLPTARQVKRIESVTRSPVYNHFSETITGASVIRAYKSESRFIQESQKRVDDNCVFFYAANVSARWIGITMEFLSNLLVLSVVFFSVASTDLNGSEVGLSLTYALQLISTFNLLGQSISSMEMIMVSVERVVEYTHLEPEANWVIPELRPPASWPQEGSIRFQQYATRYRPDLELVLRGIDCDIKSGEKIGIVGRTGAGKSSLTLSLFRLIESAGGSITIDAVRISEIGLHDLRRKITVLPQDPVIFSGSLKSNVDPLGRFDDADVWKALESVHLKTYIQNQPEKLMYECGEGGRNLSIGQRQLVCLGRALLHKNKILILDEATAAVDMETDEFIQQTIRTDFADCTVVTIAHRLNTIMDYDRVMVMDQGIIAECDTPKNLLHDSSTIFHGMAKDADLLNWFDK